MFKAIKALFSKKQETVDFSDLKSITEDEIDRYLKDSKPRFDELITEIIELKAIALDDCNKLLEAKLHNPNITEKEKHFMVGNRESYIKHSRLLIEKISLPKDIDKVDSHFIDLNTDLEQYMKNTLRPLQILNHFFEDEAGAVHRAIGNIKKRFDELYKIANDKQYISLKSIIASFSDLDNLKQVKKDIEKEIKQLEHNIAEEEKQISHFESEIKKKEKSKEYKEMKDTEDSLKAMEKELDSIKSIIITRFAKIERALRKYERISMQGKVVEHYLENPFNTMKESTEKDIKDAEEMLTSLSDIMHKGKIEVKNPEKIISEIDDMIKEGYIKAMGHKIKSRHEDIEKAKDSLANFTVKDDIESLVHKKEQSRLSINSLNITLKSLKEKHGNLSEKHIKEQMKKDVKEALDAELVF